MSGTPWTTSDDTGRPRTLPGAIAGPGRRRWSLACALGLVLAARPAQASPLEFVSPRDPLRAELRVLELYDQPADSGRFRLPHFHTWPLRRLELMGDGPPIGAGSAVRTLVAERIERELQRDAVARFASERARRSTPRLVQREWPGGERLKFSAGVEGAAETERIDGGNDSRWRDGSGLHLRGSAQVDRWLLHSHLTLGHLEDAGRYTDVLLSGSDLALQTDESYIAYGAGTQWSVAMGRQRFAWGPGEEGSLLLSRTAAPLTALHLHARLGAVRADFPSLSATVDPATGEQLAAHRLEWQPTPGVRLGVAEAARYQSSGWQAVYVAGVIPYSLAQRLQQQDGDSTGAGNRNNVLFALDASWRPADGTRVYGEFLVDDAHAKSADFPNKYAWQAGLDGAWTRGFSRLGWNTEYTWVSRYVYTSYYGRDHVAQGEPLGWFLGPDSRRLRARVTWDPRVDWQLSAVAARSWKGENDLDEPFVPGSPVPPVGELEGVAEVTDDVVGQLRWWPASGVDLSCALGWRRREDAGHVPGVRTHGVTAALAFRLVR